MTAESRQTIYPALRYADAWAAIAFLEQAFGFTRSAVFEGPDHTVGHAELYLGTASVGLNTATPPEAGNPWTSVRGGVYVVLPDSRTVDDHHARAVSAGARIARPLADTGYGSHDYSVWDLADHLWCFGTYAYAPAGAPCLSVELRYPDPQAAATWLARAFDIAPASPVGGAARPRHSSGLWLGSDVLIAGPSDDDLWGRERQATRVHVAAPDEHHARAVAHGAVVVRPLATAPGGARGYTARDPEGCLWTFSTDRPAA